MIQRLTFLLAACLALLPAVSPRADTLGKAPAYAIRALSEVPNAAAVTRRIWAPGLDAGFVPQGVTIAGSAVFVTAYRSVDPAVNVGPCRLYRLDPETGTVTGMLDLPPSCGHAGGLTRGTPGHLVVADTRVVFEIAIDTPSTTNIGRVVRTVALDKSVKGSFVASSATALWLGEYARDGAPKLLKFTWPPVSKSLKAEDASAAMPLPLLAQGAAFDSRGRLWVTRSGSKFGELLELHPETGSVRGTYAMPAGIEDLSFDALGGMWSVSEAGARRWAGWATFYPILFRLDPTRLK